MRPVGIRALALALTAAAIPATAVPAWSAAPELSFEEQSVVVTGVTPGGEVSLFGISRGYDGIAVYELRHDAVLTADGEGIARLELEVPLSLQSVWSAVVLETGEVGLGVPTGGVLRVARESLSIDAGGLTMTERRRYADVQWIRPGAGVWGARLGDGAAGDADGRQDRSIRASVSAFSPVGAGEESPPPDRLAPGDVVVVIDPEALEISVTRLPEPGSEPKA